MLHSNKTNYLENQNSALPANNQTIIVTLLGEYLFKKTWFPLCTETWNLAKLSHPIYIINDGTLTRESKEKIASLGFILAPEIDINTAVNSSLSNYPAIRELREKSILFKKLIDTSLFFSDKKILFVDSDVVFTRRFILPSDAPALLFCIDEIPGYGGSWQVPLRHPIVTALNSGFIYFEPAILDVNYLDYIAHNYLLRTKNIWWLEQTCWALLAARIKNKGIFEGKDACVIGGLKKRTPAEIRLNQTTYFRRYNGVYDLQTIELLIADAAVVHFAGSAKTWIEPIYHKIIDNYDHEEVSPLKWKKVENASYKERLLIGARMAIKG
ncbi:hypothetical protein [Nodularia sphaerocarpa]|uniref:hypothetical protein n=1 Tax=Nodularia sphaerocarpa TaxID=137816 RepID=UPI001EFA6957|nr:hypothetical protein [Nodularia sphaerocarpa]MDB9376154.1 hypothetical protein [Nodularia sphaerocarpa CS-585]MDB9376816.1 hypothetical protein [Nodularia sphaerocarpa CS-585A2]ULP74248.1 hypothetical protein BDGGKGIB_03912 [Nodularia sphaerocarpa UHCC 0038]